MFAVEKANAELGWAFDDGDSPVVESQKRGGARAADALPCGGAVEGKTEVSAEGVNTRDLGPRIEERRPGFWIEFLLFLVGGYLAGVLSIITCEQRNLWVAAVVGAAVIIVATALALALGRRR